METMYLPKPEPQNPDEIVKPSILSEIIKEIGTYYKEIKPDDQYQKEHHSRGLEFLCKTDRTCFMAGVNEFRCYRYGNRGKVAGHVVCAECPTCKHILVARLD